MKLEILRVFEFFHPAGTHQINPNCKHQQSELDWKMEW